MTYRVRVTRVPETGAFELDPRSAALLCLGDGDELVVERVEHRSVQRSATGAAAPREIASRPAAPSGAPPSRAGANSVDAPAPAKAAKTGRAHGAEDIEALKRAFRSLGR